MPSCWHRTRLLLLSLGAPKPEVRGQHPSHGLQGCSEGLKEGGSEILSGLIS